MKKWTTEEEQKLIEIYPELSNKEIAEILDITLSCLKNKAHKLKIYKSEDFKIRQRALGQFKKGNKPHNVGKRQQDYMSADAIERTKATRFKKGDTPINLKPIGYERVSVDGYVEIKTEKGFKLKHRIVWEKENGPIPKNMLITFRDKNHMNVKIENLEMISMQEAILRNSINQYPKELQTAIKLKNKILKHIQNGTK